jgi:uncharacterized protein (TIGR02266 family)
MTKKSHAKKSKKTDSHPGSEKSNSSSNHLNSNPSNKPGSIEDRGGFRVPIQLLVDYKSDGNYLFDFCKDMGTGGVFIETTKPQKTGSVLDLTFTIPDSKETLKTTGRVIWSQPVMSDRPDIVPGMGIQFENFSAAARKTLDAFVERYIAMGQKVEMTRKAVS